MIPREYNESYRDLEAQRQLALQTAGGTTVSTESAEEETLPKVEEKPETPIVSQYGFMGVSGAGNIVDDINTPNPINPINPIAQPQAKDLEAKVSQEYDWNYKGFMNVDQAGAIGNDSSIVENKALENMSITGAIFTNAEKISKIIPDYNTFGAVDQAGAIGNDSIVSKELDTRFSSQKGLQSMIEIGAGITGSVESVIPNNRVPSLWGYLYGDSEQINFMENNPSYKVGSVIGEGLQSVGLIDLGIKAGSKLSNVGKAIFKSNELKYSRSEILVDAFKKEFGLAKPQNDRLLYEISPDKPKYYVRDSNFIAGDRPLTKLSLGGEMNEFYIPTAKADLSNMYQIGAKEFDKAIPKVSTPITYGDDFSNIKFTENGYIPSLTKNDVNAFEKSLVKSNTKNGFSRESFIKDTTVRSFTKELPKEEGFNFSKSGNGYAYTLQRTRTRSLVPLDEDLYIRSALTPSEITKTSPLSKVESLYKVSNKSILDRINLIPTMVLPQTIRPFTTDKPKEDTTSKNNNLIKISGGGFIPSIKMPKITEIPKLIDIPITTIPPIQDIPTIPDTIVPVITVPIIDIPEYKPPTETPNDIPNIPDRPRYSFTSRFKSTYKPKLDNKEDKSMKAFKFRMSKKKYVNIVNPFNESVLGRFTNPYETKRGKRK